MLEVPTWIVGQAVIYSTAEAYLGRGDALAAESRSAKIQFRRKVLNKPLQRTRDWLATALRRSACGTAPPCAARSCCGAVWSRCWHCRTRRWLPHLDHRDASRS